MNIVNLFWISIGLLDISFIAHQALINIYIYCIIVIIPRCWMLDHCIIGFLSLDYWFLIIGLLDYYHWIIVLLSLLSLFQGVGGL